jgi:hypothetical protein
VCSEDIYELAYCYNSSATNEDVFHRSIEPYVDRLVDGCNVNIIAFGTKDSGKSLLLEGSERSSSNLRGIIHYALDDIFSKLHACSIKVL